MNPNHLPRLTALAILVVALSACGPLAQEPPPSLVLEQHPLAGPPDSDTLRFEPLEGTQAAILARHANARAQRFPDRVQTVDSNPVISATGEGDELTAVLLTAAQAPPDQTVKVMSGEEVVFVAPAGLPSPILPLQGLWTYEGHWALELVYAAPDVWEGRVYIDGELINEAHAYAETFGFQLLAGRPFYFFERHGRMGYSFDGVEAELPYDHIPHYLCCSGSILNPIPAQSMVAFFAQQDSDWYYVELGLFEE